MLIERLRTLQDHYSTSGDLGPENARIFAEAADEIEQLRAVLGQIIDLDHHNHGPESRATKIARDGLNEQTAPIPCKWPDCPQGVNSPPRGKCLCSIPR